MMATMRVHGNQFGLIAVNTELDLWLRLAILSPHDSGGPDSLITWIAPQWLLKLSLGYAFNVVELAPYVNHHPQGFDMHYKAVQQLTMYLAHNPLEPSIRLLKTFGMKVSLVSFFSLYYSLRFAVWCLIANRCIYRILAWSEVIYPIHIKHCFEGYLKDETTWGIFTSKP